MSDNRFGVATYGDGIYGDTPFSGALSQSAMQAALSRGVAGQDEAGANLLRGMLVPKKRKRRPTGAPMLALLAGAQ